MTKRSEGAAERPPSGVWTRAKNDDGSECADGSCLEARRLPGDPEHTVQLQSSKRPGEVLLDREEWARFLIGAKRGDFDHV